MEIDNIISFENHGTINKNSVTIGDLTLYFSYKTIIAFRDNTGFYCCVNDWSRTTGKFINELCSNKEDRLNRIEFLKQLELCLIRHNFIKSSDELLNTLAQD